MGKNCVGQRSLFTLGVYLNVYLKHLRLMSGSGHEGSSRSFPATFNRVFQAGKQSLWVSAIVGALGYLEQQCPHCCLFHLEEDGLADFLWHRKQTSPKETALDKRVFDFPNVLFHLWVDWVFISGAVKSLAELSHPDKRLKKFSNWQKKRTTWPRAWSAPSPTTCSSSPRLARRHIWVGERSEKSRKWTRKCGNVSQKAALKSVAVAKFMLHKGESDVQGKPEVGMMLQLCDASHALKLPVCLT